MAQTMEVTRATLRSEKAVTATRLDRRVIDLLVSWAGAVLAVLLIAVGGAAMYGGNFARDNVKSELAPQNITFPPAEVMSPEETAAVGEFAGQKVENGPQAEAFSRYIGLHLAAVNDGKTYSETSAEARAVDAEANPELAATLGEKTQTLFRGEALRGMLLNAYAWWTVGQIAFFVGIGAVIAGLILALFVGFGFMHARKAARAAA